MKDEVELIEIPGVQISVLTMASAVEIIEGWIERREKHYVCICTVHDFFEYVSSY